MATRVTRASAGIRATRLAIVGSVAGQATVRVRRALAGLVVPAGSVVLVGSLGTAAIQASRALAGSPAPVPAGTVVILVRQERVASVVGRGAQASPAGQGLAASAGFQAASRGKVAIRVLVATAGFRAIAGSVAIQDSVD